MRGVENVLLEAIPRQMLTRAMNLYLVRKLLGRRGRPTAWSILGCRIGSDVSIGPRVRMRFPSNVAIGDGSAIGGTTWIDAWGQVTIGRCCILGDHIDLLTGSHDIHSVDLAGKVRPIVIEDYVWLPRRVTILPGVTVGRGAVVSTGSIVVRDVAPLAVVGGNPAQKIGERADVEFRYIPGTV
jgi:acetyltransferase-like isoleucine patch superfamily enzyme